MHGPRLSHIDDPGPLRIPPALTLGTLAVGVLGLLVFLFAAFTGAEETRQSAWAGFFVSYIFFFFIALGAAAFLAIQYVTGAKWIVVLRRLPEALTSFLYRGGFVFPLFALLGTGYIYSWAAPDATYPYPNTVKEWWLSPGVHVVKVIVYVVPLVFLAFFLVKNSLRSDRRPDPGFSQRQLRLSIIFLVAFGFLFSLFSWDVVMSVEPRWFSTMFGVYCFSGAFLSAIAAMMILTFVLRRRTDLVQGRHLYDMGTYVMGFATFMAYIGFSQFMLIWYANLEDETLFYIRRFEGNWMPLVVALSLLKFIIPFLVLMPPRMRTNVYAQVICCLGILLGQFIDIYWIVMPAYSDTLVLPGLVNVATFLGVAGIFGWSTLSFFASHSYLPAGDPDLLSSVNGDYLHA